MPIAGFEPLTIGVASSDEDQLKIARVPVVEKLCNLDSVILVYNKIKLSICEKHYSFCWITKQKTTSLIQKTFNNFSSTR